MWREVRNEELHETFDVLPWLAQETDGLGHSGAPCFLTSAKVAHFAQAEAEIEGMKAAVLVTAGLGNAERVGKRRSDPRPFGTINAALVVNQRLSQSAALEALSLMVEARTTAMLEKAPRLWPEPVTGTGTDTVALCYELQGEDALPYAGKHTPLGEAIGAAALRAFGAAITRWRAPA